MFSRTACLFSRSIFSKIVYLTVAYLSTDVGGCEKKLTASS
jgi:hypothetical protein